MSVPERWLALRVAATEPLRREGVVEALMQAGGRGVVEENDGLVTYLPEPSDPDRLLRDVRTDLIGLGAIEDPGDVTWWWQPQEDWEEVWKQGLEPRLVSPRILITPSWKTPEAEAGQVVVVVDPVPSIPRTTAES